MAISKKLRFEVFKRDGFSCQYCGRKTPEVILELDHIVPKAEKGNDDIQNLVTSCFECNRGKAGTPLERVFTRNDLKVDLYNLAEKELQLKEYNRLLAKKQKRIERDIAEIERFTQDLTPGEQFSDHGKRSMRYFLGVFTKDKILEAFDLAGRWAAKNSRNIYNSKGEAIFNYACGILHNWRREANQNAQSNN